MRPRAEVSSALDEAKRGAFDMIFLLRKSLLGRASIW